jgi:hypothetical protein
MNASARATILQGAVDTYGADLARWPDARLAGEARQALLADRAFRAHWESAASLDRALAAARASLDDEIAASGAAERVLRALAGSGGRIGRWSRRSWVAVAAALVLAAGLGSFIDFAVVGSGDGSYEVVVVDPLVFGTAAVETR